MEIPYPDDDSCAVADWIRSTGFPLDEEESELLDRIQKARYTQEYFNVEALYSLRILYWQTVGWSRGKQC